MKIYPVIFIIGFFLFIACEKAEIEAPLVDNPVLSLSIPSGFPAINPAVQSNLPTKYGVALGERLFQDKRFSGNNTVSCSSCHIQSSAFADHEVRAIGINGRVGLRNTPPIQNMAFMKFYNWDGSKLNLESQAIVPIVTHEELNSSILEVIVKLQNDPSYPLLFANAFGDPSITADRIYRSLAQYQYTLISANSKYDRVRLHQNEVFTESESRGYTIFQLKCKSCHDTELFTDQSFRNVGFPLNNSTQEAGRARVTGIAADYMSFRVPSLRNVTYTAPYGSFGQFATLMDVLDYFDNGVLDAENLDPILKANNNRIPLSQQEKLDIIAFMETLSDSTFVGTTKL